MNSLFPPLPPVNNPALARIDELGRMAADSLRNASRYPHHARTYRDCADTYNLVAGSTASDLGLATMLWDAPEFRVPINPAPAERGWIIQSLRGNRYCNETSPSQLLTEAEMLSYLSAFERGNPNIEYRGHHWVNVEAAGGGELHYAFPYPQSSIVNRQSAIERGVA